MTTEPQALKSLSCVASLTPKEDEQRNEDAAAEFAGGEPPFRGVAVADGLGSFSNGRDAARFVIERVTAHATTLDLGSHQGLQELFARVRRELREYVGDLPDASSLASTAYGTTLIVGVETPTQLIAGYTGNGAIWHLRGNFDDSTPVFGMPWSSVNYLRPHSLHVEGRERLYNLIDASEHFDDPPPTIIAVNKDQQFGDILYICTDGLYSADQVRLGADPEGALWIGAEPSMTSFYQSLRAYLLQSCEPASFQAYWQDFLQGLKAAQLLEDDATLGVIVTGDALAHQQRKRLVRGAS